MKVSYMILDGLLNVHSSLLSKQPPPLVCFDHGFSLYHLYVPIFILDYKTDSIIQTTLRHQMSSDVTIITVAHRLQTIMDADKIVCTTHSLSPPFFTEHKA